MLVLAIETSSPHGSVALLEDDGRLTHLPLDGGAVQCRWLAVRIEELLRSRQVKPDLVDVLAVGLGPGSYTGLRVGIALARSFSFAVGCDLVGVSSFAALAAEAGQEGEEVLTVSKAGMEEYYFALFRVERDGAREVKSPSIGSRAEVAGLAVKGRRLEGHGAEEIEEWSGSATRGALPSALRVAMLGKKQYQETGPTPPEAILPMYLRRSKAEINWERRSQE